VEGSILNKPCPPTYRLYDHVYECEQLFLNEDCLHLQSEDFKFFDVESWNTVFDSAVVSSLLQKHDTATKLIEDLLCLCYILSRARDKKDILFACINFLKLRSGNSSLLLKTVGYTEDIMCYITEIFSEPEN